MGNLKYSKYIVFEILVKKKFWSKKTLAPQHA